LQIFDADSEEVQREWVRYTKKVDKKMEDAVRHTIKKSLQVIGSVTQCVLPVIADTSLDGGGCEVYHQEEPADEGL
jgi:predicted Holliday junction resolvase-like endonuclease